MMHGGAVAVSEQLVIHEIDLLSGIYGKTQKTVGLIHQITNAIFH